MEKVKTLTKNKLSNTLVTDGIGNDILQGTAVAFGAMAVGVIGAWALSCIVAGVMKAGGFFSLVNHWFGAINGM